MQYTQAFLFYARITSMTLTNYTPNKSVIVFLWMLTVLPFPLEKKCCYYAISLDTVVTVKHLVHRFSSNSIISSWLIAISFLYLGTPGAPVVSLTGATGEVRPAGANRAHVANVVPGIYWATGTTRAQGLTGKCHCYRFGVWIPYCLRISPTFWRVSKLLEILIY